MTYCVGLCLEDGLVFASDSRTNAGVDYVSTVSKMHVFKPAPDRVFVILSAGNLATTQEVMDHLRRDIDNNSPENLLTCSYLFEAAEYLGRVSRAVQQTHGQALQQSGVSGEASFILGGQIQGQPHGLMMVYSQGNYISVSEETPYLQIGESKYGKPVLDRIIHMNLSLNEAARLALVSLDSTARSNLTVGPPFEVTIYYKDSLDVGQHLKFEGKSKYMEQLHRDWQNGLTRIFTQLPKFDWERPVAENTQLMMPQQADVPSGTHQEQGQEQQAAQQPAPPQQPI